MKFADNDDFSYVHNSPKRNKKMNVIQWRDDIPVHEQKQKKNIKRCDKKLTNVITVHRISRDITTVSRYVYLSHTRVKLAHHHHTFDDGDDHESENFSNFKPYTREQFSHYNLCQ